MNVGSFGLLLTIGHLMAIEIIHEVIRDMAGNLWLTVQLLEEVPYGAKDFSKPLIALSSRREASVAAAQIVAAFDLADS